MMFRNHVPMVTKPLNGGVQHKFKFPNGRGASVVRHDYSYGGESGLWELAVLDESGSLDYGTPVTNDVLGYLTEIDVADALDHIESLGAES